MSTLPFRLTLLGDLSRPQAYMQSANCAILPRSQGLHGAARLHEPIANLVDVALMSAFGH